MSVVLRHFGIKIGLFNLTVFIVSWEILFQLFLILFCQWTYFKCLMPVIAVMWILIFVTHIVFYLSLFCCCKSIWSIMCFVASWLSSCLSCRACLFYWLHRSEEYSVTVLFIIFFLQSTHSLFLELWRNGGNFSALLAVLREACRRGNELTDVLRLWGCRKMSPAQTVQGLWAAGGCSGTQTAAGTQCSCSSTPWNCTGKKALSTSQPQK